MPSQFLLTVADPSQLEGLFNGVFLKGHREPRIAVVGRSNVGKSSLINELLGARLARTSSVPGKTRALHFYLWEQLGKIIVDLPGYGYARASKTDQSQWEKVISQYFKSDSNLESVLLLLDARHGPTELDAQALDFLQSEAFRVTPVFVKVDALKTQSERTRRMREGQDYFRNYGEVFWVSSHHKTGLSQLVQHLSKHRDKLEVDHKGKQDG